MVVPNGASIFEPSPLHEWKSTVDFPCGRGDFTHGSDILDEEGIVAGLQEQPGTGASGDRGTSSEREVL